MPEARPPLRLLPVCGDTCWPAAEGHNLCSDRLFQFNKITPKHLLCAGSMLGVRDSHLPGIYRVPGNSEWGDKGKAYYEVGGDQRSPSICTLTVPMGPGAWRGNHSP